MSRQIVLRVIAKLFIPFILLFALYVQFHGDYGPGGGFQAGVIFAAAIVLYSLVWGTERASVAVPPRLLQRAMALGVLLYGGTGMAGIVLGGSFLDFSVLSADPVRGQHLGIFLVELGVGVAVAAVMVVVFYCFAGWRPRGPQR